LSAVVKVNLDVVALYRQTFDGQDKAQDSQRAKQILLVLDRKQEKEDQKCPDHTPRESGSP